jgi:hypothetical protein
MRRRQLMTIALFAGLGAVIGAGVGIVAHYVAAPHEVRTSFGWISYEPMPRRYADYLPRTAPTDWFGLLGTSVGIGLGLGVVLAAALLMTGRALVLARSDGQ